MVTFLGFTALERFSSIFVFLFIFVIVYGILTKTKVFGNNNGLSALIAVFLAILTMFSKRLVLALSMMAPWFVILFIFVLLIVVLIGTVGGKEVENAKVLTSTLLNITFGFGIAIFIFSLGFAFFLTPGTTAVNATNATNATSVWNIGINPKILGIFILLMIAAFTVRLIASSPTGK